MKRKFLVGLLISMVLLLPALGHDLFLKLDNYFVAVNEKIHPILSSPENLPETNTDFKASHANIFATLLDLLEFPAEGRRYGYAVSLLNAKSADSPERYYFVGDLHLTDEGKKYPFDK